MSATKELFQALVHAAVGTLVDTRRDDPSPVEVSTEQVLGICGRLAAERIDSERWRWRAHEAARLAAGYLAFLQPPAGWRRLDDGLLDAPGTHLLWGRDGTVVADVLATTGHDARLWTPHTRGLPRRLVRDGRELFGSGFVGVRLAALAWPSGTLLVTEPTGAPAPLVGTPVAFWPALPSGLDLAHAAAGEVAS